MDVVENGCGAEWVMSVGAGGRRMGDGGMENG